MLLALLEIGPLYENKETNEDRAYANANFVHDSKFLSQSLRQENWFASSVFVFVSSRHSRRRRGRRGGGRFRPISDDEKNEKKKERTKKKETPAALC